MTKFGILKLCPGLDAKDEAKGLADKDCQIVMDDSFRKGGFISAFSFQQITKFPYIE